MSWRGGATIGLRYADLCLGWCRDNPDASNSRAADLFANAFCVEVPSGCSVQADDHECTSIDMMESGSVRLDELDRFAGRLHGIGHSWLGRSGSSRRGWMMLPF
jgi:hypothetical protein